MAPALHIVAFRKARGAGDESAELYVNPAGERTGVVAMRPERLVRGIGLLPFLRHELSHLHDRVDPAFGYCPELARPSVSLGSHRLACERYRSLWDVSIDGRLHRKGHPTMVGRDQRRLEFAAAFPFWTEARQHEIFNALWTHSAPTHRWLQQLVCDARQYPAHAGPRPGAPCPLCGFPTFAWADQSSLAEATAVAIRSEFPAWRLEHGVCARCHAIYRHRRAPQPASAALNSTG